MPLRIHVETLDDVPGELREHYVFDGKRYALRLVDLDDVVGGLKSALRKERELNRAIKHCGVTLESFVADVAEAGCD